MINTKNTYSKAWILCTIALITFHMQSISQQHQDINLNQLLHHHKLITNSNQHTRVIDTIDKHGITTEGIVWLKDSRFDNGILDVDLRGKDVFLQSFLGLAFHAADTSTFDVVYFRPFNFRHTDTLRRKWSVQYMSLPNYNYTMLRKEHPFVYENTVTPVPRADEWFHATIIIKDEWISVFVNRSQIPSLRVRKLTSVHDGMIGLWTSSLSGDFANLSITTNTSAK